MSFFNKLQNKFNTKINVLINERCVLLYHIIYTIALSSMMVDKCDSILFFQRNNYTCIIIYISSNPNKFNLPVFEAANSYFLFILLGSIR